MTEQTTDLQRMIDDTIAFGTSFLGAMESTYPGYNEAYTHLMDLENTIHRVYAHGSVSQAFFALEAYIETLEDVEISYDQREKLSEHNEIHRAMKDTLGLVKDAPHEIILEKKAHIQHMHRVFTGLDTEDHSFLDKTLYRGLHRVELVLLLILIELFVGIYVGWFSGNEHMWLLFLLVGSIGVAVFILRITKYKRGLLLALILTGVACIVFIPRLT